jgi:hypothetical protein
VSTSDILSGAPLFLQKRYGSIKAYVRSIIETEFPRLDVEKIPREDLEFIQLIAFIYVLHSFIEDGHRAAKEAVRIFGELDVRKFSIGSSRFAEGSEAVLLGEQLARDLLERIQDQALRSLIAHSPSVSALVRKLFEGLEHA